MKAREFLDIEPASLHLPSSRRDGADPVKLHRQLAKHGMSTDGMPPLEVKRGSDGELLIYDGVTGHRTFTVFPQSFLTTALIYDGGFPGGRRLVW